MSVLATTLVRRNRLADLARPSAAVADPTERDADTLRQRRRRLAEKRRRPRAPGLSDASSSSSSQSEHNTQLHRQQTLPLHDDSSISQSDDDIDDDDDHTAEDTIRHVSTTTMRSDDEDGVADKSPPTVAAADSTAVRRHVQQAAQQRLLATALRVNLARQADTVEIGRVPDGRCPICWDEQIMVQARADEAAVSDAATTAADNAGAMSAARKARMSRAKTAMAQHVQNGARAIFDYERAMVGSISDEAIFAGMLRLRRRMIEAPLAAHAIPFRRWTMADLRSHFDVRGRCKRNDPVRELAAEKARLQRIADFMDSDDALFPADPATGRPVLNLRVAEARLRLSRHLVAVNRSFAAEVNSIGASTALDAVRWTVNRGAADEALAEKRIAPSSTAGGNSGNNPPATATTVTIDHIASMHAIGGV
jgi:hypothetical protein